jgi:hypothetical protein
LTGRTLREQQSFLVVGIGLHRHPWSSSSTCISSTCISSTCMMELELATVGEALSRTGGPWTALESAYVGNALPSTAPERSDRSLGQETAPASDGVRASARLGFSRSGPSSPWLPRRPSLRTSYPRDGKGSRSGCAAERPRECSLPPRFAPAPVGSGEEGIARRREETEATRGAGDHVHSAGSGSLARALG